MSFRGYSKKGRKARRTRRASKRAGFGLASRVHLTRAVQAGKGYRLEKRIVGQHVREGKCAAAIRGLVMTGYALGIMRAEKRSTSRRRAEKGRGRYHPQRAPASELLSVADRVIKACSVGTKR